MPNYSTLYQQLRSRYLSALIALMFTAIALVISTPHVITQIFAGLTAVLAAFQLATADKDKQ